MSLTNPKDPQQKKIYNWQDVFLRPWDSETLTFDGVRSYLYYVLKKEGYKMKAELEEIPKTSNEGGYFQLIIEDDGSRKPAFGFHSAKSELYNNSRYMILHEVAHFIKDWNCLRGADHGPLWTGIFMKMIIKYLDFPEFYAMNTLTQMKISYNYRGWKDITF